MNISVIIPNLNGKHLLKQNLPSVIAAIETYRFGNKQLVFSDDGSTDGSLEYVNSLRESLEKRGIHCTFIKNKYVQGFANNVDNAVDHATGDILLLLNTDVVPNKDFLQYLVRHFSDENIFAVGCLEKTTDENGKEKLYGRAKGYIRRGFIMHSAVDANKGSSTFWISCGSGAFRKSLWDRLNGLDRIYNPFYWEDVDISYRAVKSGYKLVFEPKSIVNHYHEQGKIKSSFSRESIKKIAYRNQFIFFWKNVTSFSLWFQHIIWLPYHIFSSIVRGDLIFLSGFLSAVFLLPNIIQSRKEAERTFILSDQHVLLMER